MKSILDNKMGLNSWIQRNQNLFPTFWSFWIFVAYMLLFVNQGLLVTASRRGDTSYPFNPSTVVLTTEILKLFLSSTAFIYLYSLKSLFQDLFRHIVVGTYYLVPASIYCLYNNLAFTNLALFDPTTYFIFMQIRLLMTGLIYQFIFQRYLSCKQWLSLFLLTLGCMLQGLDISGEQSQSEDEESHQSSGMQTIYESNLKLFLKASTGIALILIQVCCSVFAGVYNEYIIKRVGYDVDLVLQNVYMYLDSILCNVILLAWQGTYSTSEKGQNVWLNFQSLFQFFVVAIIVNNSLAGIVTSLFLKNLNSIMKAFASALELILTAILSFFLLGVPVYWNTVMAVAIVAYSVILYARNPIVVCEQEEEKLRLDKTKLKLINRSRESLNEQQHDYLIV